MQFVFIKLENSYSILTNKQCGTFNVSIFCFTFQFQLLCHTVYDILVDISSISSPILAFLGIFVFPIDFMETSSLGMLI